MNISTSNFSLQRCKSVLTLGMLVFTFLSATAGGNQIDVRQQSLIQPEKIRSAVKNYIKQHAPWSAEQLTIQKIEFNRAIKVPSGKTALKVSAPKHTDWMGAIRFTVSVLVDGRGVAGITVPVNIEVWSDVVTTMKPLGKYQPIRIDDVVVKKMNLARIPSSVIVDIDQVLGRRTNRNIAANCILRKDHVEIPPIVNRGDIVQVVAESPILKIAVKGIAKQNGRQGDRIKVVNLRSKKTIYALVIGDRTVRVDF